MPPHQTNIFQISQPQGFLPEQVFWSPQSSDLIRVFPEIQAMKHNHAGLQRGLENCVLRSNQRTMCHLNLQLRQVIYLCQPSTEAVKYFLHVATFLHGNNSKVILFIDPNKEGLVIIVPRRQSNQSAVFPTSHFEDGTKLLITVVSSSRGSLSCFNKIDLPSFAHAGPELSWQLLPCSFQDVI